MKSVNQGVVLLSGNLPAISPVTWPRSSARLVPGVHSVASEVTSCKYGRRHRGFAPQQTPRAPRSNSSITMTTKLRLISDGDVPALDIGVDTHDGRVTLFGVVPTVAAKEAAELDTKRIDSVRSVSNDLQVVPTAKREWVDTKDEMVTETLSHVAQKTNPISSAST